MASVLTDIQHTLHTIKFFPKKRMELFLSFSSFRTRAALLLRLSKYIQKDIITKLSVHDIVHTLEHMDPDDATDIIQLLPQKKRQPIIAALSKELRQGVELLTQFDPKTAAGLMNIDYVQVEWEDTIATAIKKFKAHEQRTGRPPIIIVVKEGAVQGYIPGYILGIAKRVEKIHRHSKRIHTVQHNDAYKKIIALFKEYPHQSMVVLGTRGNILGIIYSNDMLRALEEQTTASLYDFAGVHDEESVTDSTRAKVRARYKWLIINLGTGFLAAATVGIFQETIATYVILASYMPIVAGMGGNAATQTLAVIVRGISLRQIDLATALPTLRREIFAGVINGVINGSIVALIVLICNNSPLIAAILGIAMVINLFVAAFFGTLIPLVMAKLGKDPAASATIFITTATDVLGFLAFLGLATILL